MKELDPVRGCAPAAPPPCNTSASIPLWVGKMSTWQVMVIGGICAFQIGSLCGLGNQDMAAKCPVCSPGS